MCTALDALAALVLMVGLYHSAPKTNWNTCAILKKSSKCQSHVGMDMSGMKKHWQNVICAANPTKNRHKRIKVDNAIINNAKAIAVRNRTTAMPIRSSATTTVISAVIQRQSVKAL
jgi:hypothetical protein